MTQIQTTIIRGEFCDTNTNNDYRRSGAGDVLRKLLLCCMCLVYATGDFFLYLCENRILYFYLYSYLCFYLCVCMCVCVCVCMCLL